MSRHALTLAAVVGALVAFTTVAPRAQDAPKPVKATITLDHNTKVGANVLKAGDYQIVGGAADVTFRRLAEDSHGDTVTSTAKPLVVPCTRKALEHKADQTELTAPPGADGVPVLKEIQIDGSAVAFDFN